MSKFIARALPALGVIAVGAALAAVLIAMKPKPEMKEKEVKSVPVRFMTAAPSTQKIMVDARGTVIPARQINLMPEITGRIVELSPNVVPGGYLEEGEVIARVDDRDYQASVKQARAMLAEAQSSLELERGRQKVARKEWEFMKEHGIRSESGPDLALRKPQLNNAQAMVSSASGGLTQAKLALERTVIKSPMNAIVKTESAEVGQLVSPQSPLATLVGADQYWVQVSVPVSSLAKIDLPDREGKGGSKAIITHDAGPEMKVTREGRVIRLLGDLEPAGRMARLMIEIDDPLGLDKKAEDRGFPLLIDAYVKVEIEGQEVNDVFVIPRTAVHEGEQIWIMDSSDRLDVREPEIVWRTEMDVLISGGLAAGEKVVTSNIPTPVPGILLREFKD